MLGYPPLASVECSTSRFLIFVFWNKILCQVLVNQSSYYQHRFYCLSCLPKLRSRHRLKVAILSNYLLISWSNSCILDLSIVIFSTVPWEKAVFNKESDAFLERNMSFGWKECLLALVKKLEDSSVLNVNGVDRNWEILSETNFFQLRLRLRLYRVIKANFLNSHSLRSPICVSCEVTIDEFVENCGYGSSHSLLALISLISCPDL